MNRGRALSLALCLCLAGAGRTAQAEAPQSADELFRAGRQASESGEHRTACHLYQRSLEIDESRGTRLNLALCQIEIGELVEAAANLRSVGEQLAPSDERQVLVKESLDALERRTPRLTIIADLPADAEIRCDQRLLPRATLDRPLPINPGEHELVVTVQGSAPNSVHFTLREGEQRSVSLHIGARLDAAAAAAPVAVAPAPAPPSTSNEPAARAERDAPTSNRGYAYALLGLAGAGVATVGVSSALIARENGIIDDNCVDKHCNQDGLDAGARGRRLVVIAAISGGVAALSGGIALYLLRSEQRPAGQARLDLVTGGDGAYVKLTSRW